MYRLLNRHITIGHLDFQRENTNQDGRNDFRKNLPEAAKAGLKGQIHIEVKKKPQWPAGKLESQLLR